MESNQRDVHNVTATGEDSRPAYELAVLGLGNVTAGGAGERAAGERVDGERVAGERGPSLHGLARKHRVAARRDKKKGQTGAAAVVTNDNKSVANGNKVNNEDAYLETPDGRFPRSSSQERVFALTGSVTHSANIDNVENMSSQFGERREAETSSRGQQPQALHPNHKLARKKLRWKEETRQGGSCDADDVFAANEQAEFDEADKISSETQTQPSGSHGGFKDIKRPDLQPTIATCDHMGDNARVLGNNTTKEQENNNRKCSSVNGNNSSGSIVDEPRRKPADMNRNVPRLERQAAFSAADYSSSSDSDSDHDRTDGGRNTYETIYNVDLLVKGQGHSQGQEVKSEEDIYVPLWTAGKGKKVSTTVQYKSDDTYVPIWTTNMPKTKREIKTSQSMDNTLLEGHGEDQGENQGQGSPCLPKNMSLDVGANKTTHVIQREKLPQQINESKSQGQVEAQLEIGRSSGAYDNNRNFNGHLNKLKLVYGASDLPQVHGATKASDPAQRLNQGQDVEPEPIEVHVPSLLERRGILLKEASSEDRPPVLLIKHGRSLRAYDQIGRSLEKSRSNRLYSGATWDQQRSTDVPPGGQKGSVNRGPRDENGQPIGALQKLKRHLSRSKSYSVDQGEASQPPAPQDVAPRRHKNYFDLAVFTCCCCISPLGIVAIVLSVISDIWWRVGEVEKAHKYSRATLILCVLGIITTISLWSALLATNALPFIKHIDTGESGHQFSA